MAATIPNTVFEYTIDSDGTFPNKRVDIASFTDEIQASAISVALLGITIVSGNCVIGFASNANVPPGLSAAEIQILDGLVTAHVASPAGEPHMIPYIWQVKNPPAALAATAMKVIGLAGIIDEYNLMRPAVPGGVNIRLKNPLTQGSITLTLTKNNVATARSKSVLPANGRKKVWLLNPGSLIYQKNDTIGIQYATSADMLPAADNEIVANIEMSWSTL